MASVFSDESKEGDPVHNEDKGFKNFFTLLSVMLETIKVKINEEADCRHWEFSFLIVVRLVAKISDDKIAIGVKMAPNSSLNPGSLHRLDRRLMALASSRISQLS